MSDLLMTLAEWRNSPDLMDAWARTWEEPHMKKGLAVLMAVGLPKTVAGMLPTGTTLTEFLAARSARDAGYFDAIRNIEKLKEPAPKPTEPEKKAWGDVKRDDLDPALQPET